VTVIALVGAVRSGLAELADPVKAPQMQRYMRSAMPYRGVAAPERKRLTARLFAEYPLAGRAAFVAAARELWRGAEFREERYAVVDLTGCRAYAQWQRPDLLTCYEELITSGAWWDYVDEIAIRRIGPILDHHPDTVTEVMRTWSTDHDPWKRRTSIICQIGRKADTDLDLLADCIEANIDERDFFLRKGIGWALRQQARIMPDWVAGFVADHPRLSPLSRREALKHIGGSSRQP
jgi:3-methyladenine DNA glycosylase AlkD